MKKTFFFFFGATFWKVNSEKTKHGQMLGREANFARNTTSSQKKRLRCQKYCRAGLPMRIDFGVPLSRKCYEELKPKMDVRRSQTGGVATPPGLWKWHFL